MIIKLGACFGHPGHSYQDHDQRIIFEVHVSQGGGRGQGDFPPTKSIRSKFSNIILMSASLI